MSQMVKLTTLDIGDSGWHQSGFVWIKTEYVASIEQKDYMVSQNRTSISLSDGTRYSVEGLLDEVKAKLHG